MKRFSFAVIFGIVFLCFSFLAAMVIKSFPDPVGEGPAFVVAIIVFLLSIVVTKRLINKVEQRRKDRALSEKGYRPIADERSLRKTNGRKNTAKRG